MDQNDWDTPFMIYTKAQSVLRPDGKNGRLRITISLSPDKQVIVERSWGLVRATLYEPGKPQTGLNDIAFASLKPQFGFVKVKALDLQTDLEGFDTYEAFKNRLSIGMDKRA
jgi:hypothetical protein